MNMNPGERSSHPSSAQIEVLVDFLEQNPGLAKGFLRTQYARERGRRQWEEMSVRLNSIGGSIKTYKQWTKYWSDKKSAIKKKKAALDAARRDSDRILEDECGLTEMDERILALCGGEGVTKAEPNVMGYHHFLDGSPLLLKHIFEEPAASDASVNTNHSTEITVMKPEQINNENLINAARRLLNSIQDVADTQNNQGSIGDPLHPSVVSCQTSLSPTSPSLSPSAVVIKSSPHRSGSVSPNHQPTDSPLIQDDSVASRLPCSRTDIPSLSGTTASSRHRHRSNTTGSHIRQNSQRRITRITERFLRVEEQRIQLQLSNAEVIQAMVKRDQVLAEAVGAMGEGLKALADVVKSFKT